ncbi:MAG: hypothetical protein FJ104_01780, partial [Deltaproteobacteria bacterium]|nr:hypothetical protein [Deltaproteobacteria bacterium]
PGTVRALDGATAGAAESFELVTPRIAVVGTDPPVGAADLEPRTRLVLELNQPVDPRRASAGLGLAARIGGALRPIPIDVEAVAPDLHRKLRVVPREPLPLDSEVVLQISPDLVGEEGPLGAEPATLAYRTYPPLRVESLDCDRDTPHQRCAAGGTLGLSLSTPVRRGDLRRALEVTPATGIRLAPGDDADETTYASLVGAFAAGGTYRVRLAAGVRDVRGQRLARDFVRVVKIDDQFPRVELGVSGGTLRASSATALSVSSVNVPRYDLTVARVRPEDVAALLDRGEPVEQRVARLTRSPSARTRRVEPSLAEPNRVAAESLSLAELLPGGRGLLAVAASFPAHERDPRGGARLELVKVTDLAITAKISRHGSLVWVTELGTGKPAVGARVRLLRAGQPDVQVVTDAAGLATLAPSVFAPDLHSGSPDAGAWIVAEQGGDVTFERVQDYLGPWRFGIATDLSGELRTAGMLFTDRGIYRPGDTVLAKGIVRRETPTGSAVPAGLPLLATLRSPEDEILARAEVSTGAFGTFAPRLVVPAAARLGSHSVVVEDQGREVAREWLEVAEYRPAEHEVKVSPDQASRIEGERASVSVSGRLLLGAAMAGAGVRAVVSREPFGVTNPGAGTLVTDADALWYDTEEGAPFGAALDEKSGVLDARGELRLDLPLKLPGMRGPERVRVDAEVTDRTRQVVAGSGGIVVHPASHAVGIRPPESPFVTAPGRFTAKVAVLAHEGARLAGRRVEVELVERRWATVRRPQPDGTTRVTTDLESRVVSRCEARSTAEDAACQLAVERAGYHVLVARALDAAGRKAQAALGLYALGSGASVFPEREGGAVELVADRDSYRVGSTAAILIKSPFPRAEAFVTVERAGVLHAERVVVTGPTPVVKVPVTEAMRPNAFVSVHLIGPAGRGEAAPYRAGYAPLTVDSSDRKIGVTVAPRATELRPGEEVTVDLAARDAAGRGIRAELAVWAVDEGVLQLTAYRRPDPLGVFAAPRPLQVATLESRDALARLFDPLGEGAEGLDKGAPGGGGGLGARRDFRQTAFFDPQVVTDGGGRATVRFRLPDALTSYRVLAVAVSEDDRYGGAEARVTASRPLMARPALPRALRVGDRLDASVVVTSKGLPAGPVDVSLALSGLRGESALSRRIELPASGATEVTFPVSVEHAGDAQLTFDVARGKERDRATLSRRASLGTALEATAASGSTDRLAAEGLADLRAVRPDVGGLELVLSSSALVGVDQALESLVDYPYACTEQLASRLLPLLPLRELGLALGFAPPPGAAERIRTTVSELVARQTPDGGFSMWPETGASSPFVSAWAALSLELAARAGEPVPATIRERSRAYLRRLLEVEFRDGAGAVSAALAVDVLAELGDRDAGHVERLFARRAELTLAARALLLHAATRVVPGGAVSRELARDVAASVRFAGATAEVVDERGDGYASVFDSDARSQALVLRALVTAEPRGALVAPLARALVESRRGGTWRSTQESAWALLALDDYRRAREAEPADYAATVWLGDTRVQDLRFGARAEAQRLEVPLSRLVELGAGRLVLEKRGRGTLHYEARLRTARREQPRAPLDAGFYVERRLVPVRQGQPTAPPREGEVTAGDLVRVELTVVASGPRDWMVLDDPIPSGLEAVDPNLATTAAFLADAEDAGPGPEDRDAVAEGRADLTAPARVERRDDRVLFFVDHLPPGVHRYRYLARATTRGTFVHPPTSATEMYRPEHFGRTAGGTLVVR